MRESAATNPVVRWAFYGFVSSIPFESLLAGSGTQSLSLSKLVGYFFILTTVLQPRRSYRCPPAPFWCFALYVWAFLFVSVLHGVWMPEAMFGQLFRTTQLLILFWLSYNLMREAPVIDGMLLSLGASCALLALLQALNITSTHSGEGLDQRVSVLNDNLNYASANLDLGLLALVGITWRRTGWIAHLRFCCLAFVPLVGLAIVETGSRGGLLALAIGILPILLPLGAARHRARNLILACLLIGFLVCAAFRNSSVRTRWQKTLTKGQVAGRDRVYSAAWQMFLEKPIAGWGPAVHIAELQRRTRSIDGTQPGFVDTHNMWLWLLTETGLLGFLPFVMGIVICAHAAWRGRHSRQGMLPLAMVTTVLVFNLSGSWQGSKLHWLVMAYAYASALQAIQPRRIRWIERMPSDAAPNGRRSRPKQPYLQSPQITHGH